MLRRSHKKSWGGCVQCKKRHVKCDEGRPVCLLCSMSGRDCSFASQGPTKHASTPSVSRLGQPTDPGNNHSQNGAFLPNATPSTASTSGTDPSVQPSSNNNHEVSLDEAVNPNHVELLMHLMLQKQVPNLGIDIGDYPSNITFALETGLNSPYLLHQLLAFSARQLAFIHPKRSAFFLHQAVTLQTHAVSLFNATWTDVDETNCVAIFLYSALLGHHLLTDTLAKRDSGGLEAFITHYIQCVELHRGVYTIARATWPQLLNSELGPTLSRTAEFTSREPRGDHCQRIRKLIDSTERLGAGDKEACRTSIDYLQVGFDSVEAKDEERGIRHQMIYSWMLLAPPEFTGLLAARKPEVLVLLAYYAVLLHFGREMWQVGDAGAYIFGIISDYLGPEWDHWLEYPREVVGGDLM